MAATITPIDATLGATITDIDLADMDAATWQVVEDAFHEFAALVFPGQDLSDEAQVAFASRFGEIELLRADPDAKAVAVSNQKPDGTLLGPDEHRYQTLRGNEGWHTDSSYMPLAAKASVLSAQVVPSAGGETQVADMRAPTTPSTRTGKPASTASRPIIRSTKAKLSGHIAPCLRRPRRGQESPHRRPLGLSFALPKPS